MQRNRTWMAEGVFVLVFVLGLASGLQASVCDEDPPYLYPMKFRPVLIVGPLVDLLMDWYLSEVGGALPEEMDVEYYLDPEDPDNFNLYGHTLILHLSDVEGELTDSTLQITSEVGLVTVRIDLPGFSSHVDIIDVVNEESCGPDVICQIENGIFDLLPGMDLGMTIDENSSYIAQTAEVCVLPGCTVAYPLSGYHGEPGWRFNTAHRGIRRAPVDMGSGHFRHHPGHRQWDQRSCRQHDVPDDDRQYGRGHLRTAGG